MATQVHDAADAEGPRQDGARPAQDQGPAEPPTPHVLELRIHGVSNTPPAALLEADEADVERVRGDSLGSFWTLTPQARERASDPADQEHHDFLPPGVRREAYSWGHMARSSPSAPAVGPTAWVQRVSRAGWLLLIPLGLANTAYWSRRLTRDPARFARGSGPVRVFALGLTLLVVMASCVVALDLVATQCFVQDGVLCPNRPGFLDALQGWTWTRRLAAMSVVPVAVLALLWWLSAGSRVRYEQVTSSAVPAPPGDGVGRAQPGLRSVVPVGRGTGADEAGHAWSLAHPDLWSRWGLTGAMAQLHVAAGLCVLVLLNGAAQAWGGTQVCRSLPEFVEHAAACSAGSARGGYLPAALVFWAALVLLSAITFIVWRAQYATLPSTRTRTGWRTATTVVVVATVVVLVVDVVLLLRGPAGADAPASLIGLSFFPLTLLAVMLLVALIAPTWRASRLRTAASGAVGLGTVLVLALSASDAVDVDRRVGPVTLTGILCACGVALLVLLALPSRRRTGPSAPRPRDEGWWGWAPAVWLLLSLGAVVMLTSLMTVAVGDWLNGGAAARCLDGHQVATLACAPDGELPAGAGDDVRAGEARMLLPPTYPLFAATVPLALLLAIGSVLGGLVVHATSGRKGDLTPAGPGEPADLLAAAAARDAEQVQPAGPLAALLGRSDLAAARLRTRRLAAAAKRAELVLLALALSLAVALCLALWLQARPAPGEGALALPLAWVPGLTTLGMWSTALLWGALLLRVVTTPSGGRPAGLLWDLMCFLPRSAHPFGPPCYAERAVPEIAGRVENWLQDPSVAQAERARRVVVLSAHSLGAVLAVAAVFTRPAHEPTRRVALLTYGTQLRAYFGRFFPELLGPQVLGTEPCPPARVRTRDPWPAPAPAPERPLGAPSADGESVASEQGPDPAALTLIGRLRDPAGTASPAWVNLWRATDPLGMPVASDAPNYVDRPAEELDASAFVATVGTHGGYPRTTAYKRAFAEVLDRLDRVNAGWQDEGVPDGGGTDRRAVGEDGLPLDGLPLDGPPLDDALGRPDAVPGGAAPADGDDAGAPQPVPGVPVRRRDRRGPSAPRPA